MSIGHFFPASSYGLLKTMNETGKPTNFGICTLRLQNVFSFRDDGKEPITLAAHTSLEFLHFLYDQVGGFALDAPVTFALSKKWVSVMAISPERWYTFIAQPIASSLRTQTAMPRTRAGSQAASKFQRVVRLLLSFTCFCTMQLLVGFRNTGVWCPRRRGTPNTQRHQGRAGS